MTSTQADEHREDFTPPLPHDPPPPPGYVDPLEDVEVLADLSALMRSSSEPADGGPAPAS